MSSIRLSLSPTEYLTLDQHAFFNDCPEFLYRPVPSLLFAIGRTACRWTSVLLDPSLDLLIAVLQKVFSQMYVLRNKKIPIACRLYGWAKSLVERHELLFRMCCSDMWGQIPLWVFLVRFCSCLNAGDINYDACLCLCHLSGCHGTLEHWKHVL